MPLKFKGWLSKLIIKIGLKPTVNKKKKSPFVKGIVVFSADFEMAWAFRHSKSLKKKAVEMGLKERQNVPKLLKLFEKYNIPATWATVGHLFLDNCKRIDKQIPHAEMLRPSFFEDRNWSFSGGDWYDCDPCTDVETDPAWYAPDLINQILTSRVEHEIGCHTFSHVDFTHKNCTKKLADDELEACLALANKKGIKLKSMVFPGGTFGNYQSLKEKDFFVTVNQ